MTAPATNPGSRRVLVVVAVVVALVAGVVVGALAFGGGDGEDVGAGDTTTTTAEPDGEDGTTTTTDDGDRTTTTEPGGGPTTAPDQQTPTTYDLSALSGAARELAEHINRASQLTYRAVYRTVEGASLEVTVVEIMRRPPSARRNTTIGEGETPFRTAEISSPEVGVVGCLLGPEGSNEDVCVLAPAGGVDPGDPVVGAVDPTVGEWTATNEVVAGVDARCFSGTNPDGLVHVACFDREGIPVAIDGGDGRLERIGIDRGVPDDAFDLPAAVANGS